MADLSRLYTWLTGQPIKAAEHNAELNQILARLNDLEPDSLQAALAEKIGVSQTGNVRRGKSIIATEESRTNAAYGTLTTPDRVQSVVLPTDGLIRVAYSALWKESNLGAARAAIFVGANQLKVDAPGEAGAAVIEAAALGFPSGPNVYSGLKSCPVGLIGGVNAGSQVATGQAIGLASSTTAGITPQVELNGNVRTLEEGVFGGVCLIEGLAAGSYDVSVQFKASAGSVSAKERRLWVEAIGY